MAGLYVHVPFCERKCVYCDFYSVESTASGAFDAFVDACAAEIRMRAGLVRVARPFASVFFGGGTPSLLAPVQLARLLDALRDAFPVAPDAECTVECNPGTVSRESLAGYRALGINRLSFGVQSFHDDELAFLSRIHSAADARAAVRAAHEAGFANVNVDLMFSLPGQTAERWMRNLEEARALDTAHVSCYSLTVEAGTPLAVRVDRGEVRMPAEESDADLFERTMETMTAYGYVQYEVSNYARPGFACRHNRGYWRHEPYLGFGPSAHSTWDDRRWWNASSVRAYLERVTAGVPPEAGGERLTPAQLRAEHILLGLRSDGVRLAEFRDRFGEDFADANRAFLDRHLAQGTVAIEEGILRLTRRGYLVADEICAQAA